MTPDKLSKAGSALYGSRWQSEMARELGVSDRTVRRWVSGDSPVPDTAYDALRRLVAERVALLRKLDL